uniref:Major facilitator superfamily (MFS) profile domain-containing protein n=1 Tax=Salmo trutta TaxID=8032 RepID=A0A673XA66_SALTR
NVFNTLCSPCPDELRLFCGQKGVQLNIRKKALLFNIDAVMMVFRRLAKSFEVILLNIFLYGYNVGLGLSVHLVYLGESSPKKLGGFLALTSSIFNGFRKVMVRLSVPLELMGTDDMWPWLMALGGLPAILQFVTLLFFPEAPRYLYIDKGGLQKKRYALSPGLYHNEDDLMQGQKVKTMWDVLTSHCVRWQVLALVIPCAGIQFCGNNAIYFYTFDIFREAGVAEDKMHYLSIGIGTTDLLTITLCSLLIDRMGRKMVMGYGPCEYIIYYVLCPTVCLYPYLYLLNFNIINVLMEDGLGQFCFLIFVAHCILSSAFMLYFIPETKGKSTVEIMEDFNKLNYKNGDRHQKRLTMLWQ